MTLDKLIAAWDAATGPSRELDVEIALHLNPSASPEPDRPEGIYGVGRGASRQAPRYSGSLDAARSLLANDALWRLQVDPGVSTEIYAVATVWTDAGWITAQARGDRIDAEARALCAAALKARREAGR